MSLKVEKEKHKVTLILTNMKIKGYMHVMPKSRLTDALNAPQTREFIPITDAEVEINGDKIFLNLIEVNKNHVVAVYPCENNVIA